MGYQAYYFLRELLINLTRNIMMSVAAASTSTISLITLGISLIMVYNINNLATEITSQVEIRAFLDNGISNYEIKNMVEDISTSLPQVKEIGYIPPDKALDQLEEDLNIELDMSPEENPLPHSLVIKVYTPKYIGIVVDHIRDMKGIEEVKYGESILQSVLMVSMLVKFIGYLLTVIMGAGAMFTIMNTIRLTVIARRHEIRTMQLVDATGWFIRWPFLLEGVALGALGAFVAAAILAGSYYFISDRVRESFPFIFPLVPGHEMAVILFFMLIMVGSVMGFAGSYISLARFLTERQS